MHVQTYIKGIYYRRGNNMNTMNLTLLTDFYELTMMQGYFERPENEIVVFDLFFRHNPCGAGYSVVAGLEQAIEYVKNLNFSYEDVTYLRNLGIFNERFLSYLSGFHFSGDIYAIPEGTVVFPREPLVKIIAPIMEAQLVETTLLNIINHQSLIATKTSRVVQSAGQDGILEFGLRRAQGPDAGLYGARAAMIAGCVGTSNVLAGKLFNVPVRGTHAHSWIMSFTDEYTAFQTYADLYPSACCLLVDTYDSLKSGVPNAIRVFDNMKAKYPDFKGYGIRLDSGDLAYLSKKARIMLDEAGHAEAFISASNDLDENLIYDLKRQGAAITSWGVGTNMITSKDCPSFGGVYKLAAIQNEEGQFVPKIKLSENSEKITNPGNKTVYRIYDNETNKLLADQISFADESIDTNKDLLLFDPVDSWKKTKLKAGTFHVRELLVPIFIKGECVYQSPSVMEIAEYCKLEKATLWDEVTRLFNPHKVYVDLSHDLYNVKQSLLTQMSKDED